MTIDEIKQLLEAATPGPWWFDNNEGYGANNVWGNHKTDPQAISFVAQAVGDSAEAEANAQFIAYARSAVPQLVTENARLRDALTFYAEGHSQNPNEGPWGMASTDFGQLARVALGEPK